jgi:hypothetical protein
MSRISAQLTNGRPDAKVGADNDYITYILYSCIYFIYAVELFLASYGL